MSIKHSKELHYNNRLSEIQLQVYGRIFSYDKKLLIARSRKLFNLLKQNQNYHSEYPFLLPDIPGNLKVFEIAMRFCYGYEPKLSSDNVIPVICLAYYLDMTDEHSPNNLLPIAIDFYNHNVLPVWHESLKALGSTEQVINEATQLGILDVCLESLVRKACEHPNLLGEPLCSSTSSCYQVTARRRLFLEDSQYEELTLMGLQVFELFMSRLILAGTRPEYVAAAVFRYVKKWVHVDDRGSPSVDKENYQRKIVETGEKLLPNQVGVLPCKFLVEMLRTAVIVDAGMQCREGFEIRIGKQLEEATAEELLIPFHGYACEVQYDTECVKRILKAFYANYTSSDQAGLVKIAHLIDEFLAVVAAEADLNKDTFISLLKLSDAASAELDQSSDGMYRAIDVYLDRHKHLTDSEREEVCQSLDCHRLSPGAYTHAAQNGRLPLRLVVQTLFVGQLQLRDAISHRIDESEKGWVQSNEMVVVGDNEGEEAKMEMENIDNRVMELEKECLLMKKRMEKGNGLKEKRKGVWKKLKRKFGCVGDNMDEDCACPVKKKIHPGNCF